MDTWYLKVEGAGKECDEWQGPFGFFVHCLVTCHSISEAKQLIANELANDEMTMKTSLFEGKYDTFVWNDNELKEELDSLRDLALNQPRQVFFSIFDIWPTETTN